MEGRNEERGERRKEARVLWVYCILGINKQIHCGNIGISVLAMFFVLI